MSSLNTLYAFCVWSEGRLLVVNHTDVANVPLCPIGTNESPDDSFRRLMGGKANIRSALRVDYLGARENVTVSYREGDHPVTRTATLLVYHVRGDIEPFGNGALWQRPAREDRFAGPTIAIVRDIYGDGKSAAA